MKIYLDNELSDFRKVVCIKSSYSEIIYDDIDVIIDALKAYGYTDEAIQEGFLKKCLDWELINRESEDDDANI